MANFPPLNNYTLYILDKIIPKYNLKPPFLDGGCGTGYVSRYLASKGWNGKAIDLSEDAVLVSKKNLASFKKIKVARESILTQKRDKFNTIILFDVIEHIKDDERLLKKVNQLLKPGGSIILALTSNPKEWGWDDEFYGHFRRYNKAGINLKLSKAGFKPKEFIEYTFPVFWLIRALYITILKPPKVDFKDKKKRTNVSGISSAWSIPSFLNIFLRLDFLWKAIFFFQYLFFRRFTSYGFAMLAIAEKPGNSLSNNTEIML